MGMYVAFAYFEFRETGDLVLPVVGLPARIHLLARPTLASALVVAAVLALALGLVVYGLVVRPLRHSPPLARVVASLGLLLYLQEVVRLQFPITGAAVAVRRPVLPEDPVRLLGTTVSQNRLLLAVLALGVAALLTLVFRVTRIGLATRAAADSEKGALLIGLAPDRLASCSWAVASLLGGMAVILIEPISGLNATTTPLLVVPAVAAALVGRLQSFTLTTVAGLGIGMVQSLVLGYAVRPSTTWIPDWLPTTGLQAAVPVVLIMVVLLWRGDALPTRATLIDRRLPAAPTPRHVATWTALLGGAAIAHPPHRRRRPAPGPDGHHGGVAAGPVVRGRHRLQRADLRRPAGLRRGGRLHRGAPDRPGLALPGRGRDRHRPRGRPGHRRRLPRDPGAGDAAGRRHPRLRGGHRGAGAVQPVGVGWPRRQLGPASGPVRARHRGERPGRRQLPPRVGRGRPRRAGAGRRRGRQPAPEPHRAPVARGPRQRARPRPPRASTSPGPSSAPSPWDPPWPGWPASSPPSRRPRCRRRRSW